MFRNINRKLAFYLAVTLLLLFLSISHASAQPITVPSGLSPGDKYRLAFVTSTLTSTMPLWIDYYNDFVTSVAELIPELAALGTTWKAIASTVWTDARTNTGTDDTSPGAGVPIYNLEGNMVAVNNMDLWDGDLLGPIAYDENGILVPPVPIVVTGTDFEGRGVPDNEVGHGMTRYGWPHSIDSLWIDHGMAIPANQEDRMYAISDVLVAPVPEPATILLIGTGLVGLAGLRKRFRRK